MTDTIIYDENKNEYKVQELIGRGGFGNVFRIQNGEQILAVKTLQPNISDPMDFKSFINEANNAVEIRHENVIKYYFFNDGNKYSDLPPYIIMEFANQGSLDNLMKNRNVQFSNEELLNIFYQLIRGMTAISNKLVHRDIKPQNILINDGILKITDFGLSKIASENTRHTTFKGWGTYAYISPEAWRNQKNTIQMDMYSMGLVFYELACLKFPFDVANGDPEEWQKIHFYSNPQNVTKLNPKLSPIISSIIMKMIEKDPDKRPKNWLEIETQLRKEELPSSDNSELINKVLHKRNEQEQQMTEQRLAKEKREKENLEVKNLVLFQEHRDIITPIKELLDDINLRSDKNKIEYRFDSSSFLNTIMTGPYKIQIDLRPIIEEDFYREEQVEFGRGNRTRTKLKIPKINDVRVLAWGYIKAYDGRGFNIILLQKPDNIYGNWMLLFNRHRAGIIREDSRPEPFPFEFREIEKELGYLNAAHIYVTSNYDLDIDKIKEFLIDYL